MKTLEEVFETWEAVIGLEIHAELTTLETKMFCGCKLEFGAAPNTHTCPVCLGLARGASRAQPRGHRVHRAGRSCHQLRHREALDVLPQELHVPRHGQELPDHPGPHRVLHAGPPRPGRGRPGRDRALPPGRARPRRDATDNITRTEDGYVAHVGITRIHMEEDAGKMVHLGGGEGRIAGATQSLVDYNRAGTPLDRAGDRARSAHARGGAPVHAEAAPDLPGL